MDALLSDMALAHDAGPGKSSFALSVLKRDFPSMKQENLHRERFALSKSVGWGHQGREGGTIKKHQGAVPDVEDPDFDVVGPRHFVFLDAEEGLIDKQKGLADFREASGSKDPPRRKIARRLKGGAADSTHALRTACIRANEYNALWVCMRGASHAPHCTHRCPCISLTWQARITHA